MSDFFETLKNDAKDFLTSAKNAFEGEAAAENQELNAYHDLFSWADGTLLATPYTEQDASEKDQQMKTIAVMLAKTQNLSAPADGTIIRIEPDQNLIVERLKDGYELGIKVCVGSVSFEKQAEILVKTGESVRKGQPLVHFDEPIAAKSKLLLTSEQPLEDFAGAGYVPAAKPGEIRGGEIIIRKA